MGFNQGALGALDSTCTQAPPRGLDEERAREGDAHAPPAGERLRGVVQAEPVGARAPVLLGNRETQTKS